MRFERLALERFGHFESLDLDLGGAGLAVIHGANEAGKSTLLAAIHGLLFGIDERSPYGFRFPYQAMAVRAMLRDGAGQRLELVRRKKRKDALLGSLRSDAGEVPLDEARFARYFGGVGEDLYRSIFGFSHADLQQGAEVLRVAGLGELIGGGSLGGSAEALRRVLAALRDEADELFKLRGKNPPVNRALAQIHDTRAALREATFQQPQYLALTAGLREAREELAAADAELARLRVRAARVHTLLHAFEDFHEHHRLVRRLEGPDLATPLGPADARRVAPLLAELHALEQRLGALADEAERLERRAAQHPVDHALLAEAATVERLLRRVEPVAAQRRDAPRARERLARERAALLAELERLSPGTGEMSPGTGDPGAPAGPRSFTPPPPGALARARQAHARWLRAGQELALVARGQGDDEAELAGLVAAGDALAAQVGDPGDHELLAGLERAQADHAELERGELELARLAAELELALARLHPRPTRDDLARLALPSFAAVQDMQARRQTLDGERREARHDLAEQAGELARAEAELAALLGGDLPDPAALAQVRLRRDDAWTQVRGQLLARAPDPGQRDLFAARAGDPSPGTGDTSDLSPGTARRVDRRALARGYERAVADADALADRLRAAADRLAQRGALEQAAERARLAVARAEGRLAAADAEERAWSAAWTELWRAAGVAPGAPAAMLAWLADAAAVRELAQARHRRAGELALLRPRAHAFAERARARLGEGLPWSALVQQLRARERSAEHLRGRLETTRARAAAVEAALARARVEQGRHARERDAAAAELAELAASLGLPRGLDPDAALARLDALADLCDRLAAVDRERDAADRALAALDDFDAEARALLARLEPDDARALDRPDVPLEHRLEALAAALAVARAAATTHAHARDEAAERRREHGRHAGRLADLRADRAALYARAGVADDAALSDMSERTLLREQLERGAAELGLRLARALGEGDARAAYEAELHAVRREALAAEQHALAREISELDQRRVAAAERRGRLEHEAQQLGGDRAARLGAELEVLRAELEDSVDRYVLVHLAERVLDAVAERYARENQPAILQYTSELLARMTEGRHVRVVPQPETRSLAALDRAGQLRLPAEMSAGTREQLFLALRLAYVLDYCDRCEPLPVIMDDVLVNFDDARAAAALAALRDAAASTQVVLLTCHRRWLELAPRVAPDARLIELPPGPPPALLGRPAEA